MGNILSILRLYNKYLNQGLYLGTRICRAKEKHLTGSRSQNMRKALRAWESQTTSSRKKKSKKTTRSNLVLPRRSPQMRSKWPKRTKSHTNKYKLLKKHMRKMAASKDNIGEKRTKNIVKDIKMRTRSQNNALQRFTEKDSNDPLLKTFNIAARDSPSTRCNKWVQSMPHSSIWDKEHTLSGHDLIKMRSNRNILLESRKHRKHQTRQRVEKKTSQRSLLMKKIMKKKIAKLRSSDNGKKIRSKDMERQFSYKKLNPKASAGRIQTKRKLGGSYDDIDSYDDGTSTSSDSGFSHETPPKQKKNKYSRLAPKASISKSKSKNIRKKKVRHCANRHSSQKEDVVSDNTATLKRKAKAVVRKIWSQGDKISPKVGKRQKSKKQPDFVKKSTKKFSKLRKSRKHKRSSKMWAVKEARRAHENNITKLGRKSLQRLVKRPSRQRNGRTCLKSARLEEEIMPQQMACMKTARERHDRRIQERKHKEMRDWLWKKTRSRPKCRHSNNIYARKHRPGLYLSQERNKSSLGWAILQSIKSLEKKGIPYPLAILRNMQKKWGYNELTLVQLKQALNWMTKKGILKSKTVREGEKYTTVKRWDGENRLPQRASFLKNQKEFALDESDTSLEYGIKVGKKKRGPMRVRFQHGARDFTSIKCKKYGSHNIQSDDTSNR